MADLHFVLDSLLVSAGVYLTGGVNTLFTPLYALPILSASTVQLRHGGLRMAALNATLFAGLVVAQFLAAARGHRAAVRAGARRPAGAQHRALHRRSERSSASSRWRCSAVRWPSACGSADVRLEQVTSEIADLQAFNQFVIDNLLSGLVDRGRAEPPAHVQQVGDGHHRPLRRAADRPPGHRRPAAGPRRHHHHGRGAAAAPQQAPGLRVPPREWHGHRHRPERGAACPCRTAVTAISTPSRTSPR